MNEPRSPRQWLLRRRAAQTASLDAVRQRALQSLPATEMTWRELLAEVFRPHRKLWRLVAAAWVTVAALHLTRSRPPRETMPLAPSPEASALWLNPIRSHEILAQIDRYR